MTYLVVDKCEKRACLHWRQPSNCIKHSMYLPSQMKYVANIHDADTCQVRKQIDMYRLTKMIEE